ncbi:MAG: alpha/beta hydrolase [Candidatus Saccharibacteria bacterium]|nr:alpha/beta hydrolase [Candidatus Saccharibacteria bacterium]
MQRLQTELDELGYDSVAMDVPVDDPTKDLNDYGQAVADSLAGRDNLVGIFHSRAGNYGPRAVNLLNDPRTGEGPFRQMIFLAASFEPQTLQAFGPLEAHHTTIPRHSPASRAAIVRRPDLGPDMTEFDRSRAVQFLYHDVSDHKLVVEAIRHLRPQRRPVVEPTLDRWPRIPQDYIVCTEDRMVRPDWSRLAAREFLGVDPYILPGGHSPFLSRPRDLARMLAFLAVK